MYHRAQINDGRRSHNTAARGPKFSCGALGYVFLQKRVQLMSLCKAPQSAAVLLIRYAKTLRLILLLA